MEAKEQVLASMKMAGKMLKTSEIAEICNVDKKIAEKAIKNLAAEGKIFSPVRCFWQVK